MAKDLDQKLSYMQEKIEEVSDTTYRIDKELALHKAAFESRTKQDELMHIEQQRMNTILDSNTDSLKEHMNQTMLLKEMVVKMDARLSPIETERIEQEAIKKYRNDKLKKIGKVVGIIATIVGIIIAIKSL
jgi:hypothetical protein